MRQALHIFRKDVRFLRWQIALSLALTAAFAWAHSVDRDELLNFPVTALLVLSWYALAGAAIFQERPVGDRQFWMTRPYRASSLIGAKALLLVVFIHLPLLAADLAILAAQRFPPDPAVLLWRQFGLAALITAPAAGLAALTRNFADMVITALGVLAAWVVFVSTVWSVRSAPAFEDWQRGALLLALLFAASGLTIACQYARLGINLARALAASAIVLCAIVMIEPAISTALATWSPFEPGALRSVQLNPLPPDRLDPAIRVRIEGTPAGVLPNATVLDISSRTWTSGWWPGGSGSPASTQWDSAGDPSVIRIYLPQARGHRPPTIHVSALISFSVRPETEFLRPDGRPHDTAIGRCATRPEHPARYLGIRCRNSHYPALLADFDGAQMPTHPTLYMEYLNAGPVVEFGWTKSLRHAGDGPVPLTTATPIGRVRRELDIRLDPDL